MKTKNNSILFFIHFYPLLEKVEQNPGKVDWFWLNLSQRLIIWVGLAPPFLKVDWFGSTFLKGG